MNLHRISWTISLATVIASGCGRPAAAPVEGQLQAEWFEDVTSKMGLQYSLEAACDDPYFMPSLMGGGIALIDFDNDGRLDVFLTPGGEARKGSPSKLYHQRPDGTFEDVTRAVGVEVYGFGQGVAVGDVDNDGFPDLFVTAYQKVWLFRNNGNSTFTDITREAGIDNPLWATSAALVDYDRDGWLDLVIVNYVEYNSSKQCKGQGGERDFCGPSSFTGTSSRLFRNRGKPSPDAKLRFEDVTIRSGLAASPGPGLGVVCLDFDGDRWPDIFIANDGKPNHLWINQRDGSFKEEALLRGVAYNAMGKAEANMGVAVGDIDGDGLFDLFVTHLTDEQHRMWVQTKRGQFRDRTTQVGLGDVGARSTGFGALLADLDHDGHEDLVVANGSVKRFPNAAAAKPGESFWAPYRERNQIFANDGGGRFTNVSSLNPAFCGVPGVHRVVAVGDFDNDGALDLIVTSIDGPARMYRNVAPNRGHWVMVRAIDPALNRDAYGAELSVRAGGRTWTRWMNPGYSFAASNDPRAHVGLGAVDRVDEFRIVWPDGIEERFVGCAADRAVTLRKGTGSAIGSANK